MSAYRSGGRRPAPIDVSIVTSGHDVADARLHREAAAMSAAGLSVEVLGLGDEAAAPADAAVQTWPRCSGRRRAGLAARMANAATGRALMALDPDSALACAAVAKVKDRLLIVDVHEDYARLLLDRAWARGPAGRVAAALVRSYVVVAGNADLTVVADHHVPPLKAKRRLVVPNLADTRMLPAPVPGLPGDPGSGIEVDLSAPSPHGAVSTPRALYVGDVRASRGLFIMLHAVALAPQWQLDIVGPVAPADRDRLATVLADGQDGLSQRVHFYGRRPPVEAWGLARTAWCGLLLLRNTPAFREAVPSKLYEYLACGLAVISSDLPRAAALVLEAGAGELVGASSSGDDDEAVGMAVADVLRSWAADPDLVRRHRASAVDHATRLPEERTPYDVLAAAVLDLVRSPRRRG